MFLNEVWFVKYVKKEYALGQLGKYGFSCPCASIHQCILSVKLILDCGTLLVTCKLPC